MNEDILKDIIRINIDYTPIIFLMLINHQYGGKI